MACTCGPGYQCQPLKPGCWGYAAQAALIGSTDLVTCQKCGALHMRIAEHRCPPPVMLEWPPRHQADGQYIVPYTPVHMGCICPPGANKDCEAPLCPRKNHLKAKE